MNNNIQCSIESSTTKIELNSAVDGVFLVPELEGLVGLPEIRTTSGVNAGYDGGWTSAQHYDARLISIRGVIASPDISKVEDKRRAIASLLGQGRKEQLTLRFTTEAGNAYAISVRTISCEMALQRVLTTQEFLIQLRADDPLIYDDGTTGGIAAILQPQRALGGFEINFGLPLAIGGGAEDTVVDNGNETVYPVIKMYGALHSPTVVNRTTNQQMQILADLQYSIDWHTYRSATGDYILVNGGLDGAPMTLSQLLGNAEQTTYSGKNKLNYLDAVPATNQTTTTFVDNGFRSVTTSTGYATKITLSVKQSTTYTLSWTIKKVSGTMSPFVRVYEGTGTSTQIMYVSSASDGTYNGSFTTASGVTQANIWFYNGTPSQGTTEWTFIQLEESATKTDYEPYVGGTPAPNPSYPQPISTVTGEQNIEVSGKNLWDNFEPSTKSASITWTPTDNGGTFINTETWSTGLVWNYTLDTTQQYTVQLSTPSDRPLYFYARSYTDGTYTTESTRYVQEGRGNISRTFQPDTPYVRLFFWNGQAINDGVSVQNMMFELGSTATAYEPYQGQSYEVNLGKNLLSISQDTIITNAYLNNNATLTFDNLNSVKFVATGTQGAQYLYRIITGLDSTKSYTFSFKAIKNVKGSTGLPYIRITTSGSNDGSTWANLGFSGNTNPTEGETYSFAKTLTGYSQYRFMIFNNVDTPVQIGETTTFFDMQLEEGAQTSFAPYFTPIELAKVGTYQDRIYKDDGKWYIEKQVGKVVLDGTETWASSGATVYYTSALASSVADTPATAQTLGLSDYFEVVGFDYRTGTNLYFHPNKNLQTSATNWGSLSAWTTWLSTHPTTVYYALATPTTTEITNETLLLQLNFLASLYEGENNISLVGTGVQGEMTISYATDYTVNQDVITIDSQARTITLNGQDVYHLKTSESEFLVLAPGENKLYLTSEVSDDSGYAEVKFKQGYLSI